MLNVATCVVVSDCNWVVVIAPNCDALNACKLPVVVMVLIPAVLKAPIWLLVKAASCVVDIAFKVPDAPVVNPVMTAPESACNCDVLKACRCVLSSTFTCVLVSELTSPTSIACNCVVLN